MAKAKNQKRTKFSVSSVNRRTTPRKDDPDAAVRAAVNALGGGDDVVDEIIAEQDAYLAEWERGIRRVLAKKSPRSKK